MGNRCRDKNACEPALGGTVTFDSFLESGPARGTYRLEFKDGKESGSFDAIFCPGEVPCG